MVAGDRKWTSILIKQNKHTSNIENKIEMQWFGLEELHCKAIRKSHEIYNQVTLNICIKTKTSGKIY